MKESELMFYNVFIRFLKEKKIYRNFIGNYVNCEHQLPIEHRFSSSYSFISSAFIWNDTNEGRSFWCDLSSEWKHINNKFEKITMNTKEKCLHFNKYRCGDCSKCNNFETADDYEKRKNETT